MKIRAHFTRVCVCVSKDKKDVTKEERIKIGVICRKRWGAIGTEPEEHVWKELFRVRGLSRWGHV